VSDIKPLNWTTKILALLLYLSLCFQVLDAGRSWLILWRQSYRAVNLSPRSLHYDVSLPGMRSGRIWRHGRRTERGPPRSPHFSMAIISVTVQLWIYVFWVISVYFNIRNTLPKFCPFLPGHPVYMYKGNKAWFIWKDQIRNNKENIRIRSI